MDRRGPASAYPPQRPLNRARNVALLAIVLSIISVVIFVNVSKVDYVAEGRDAVGRIQQNMHVPRPFAHIHNPFKPQAHPPPIQANSTWGEASWFSDWKWLNPFSSTITLDEDRALLPPLPDRPPIYTYYQRKEEQEDKAIKAAEDRLLEIWRRAWWAQGFKPIILGPLDAMENPMYQKLQSLNITGAVETELMRWLAWSHMGDGILANWLVLPMADYYQPSLVFLRSARYPELSRYLDLDMGLFVGAKKDIDRALNTFLDSSNIKNDKSLMDTINVNDEDNQLFRIEARAKGVAFYSQETITSSYKDVADALVASPPKGLVMLGDLITAHLHATFLAKYPDGIAVVSPYASNTTILNHRALIFAHALNTCPTDPRAVNAATGEASKLSTCPPNRKDCVSCKPLPLKFPSAAPNSTTMFTLGTITHTYMFQRLLAPHGAGFNFSVAYVRRHTTRDPFIETVTADIAPKGISPYSRIVHFKEAVAQPGKGAMRSIWRTPEIDWEWSGLEWRLGFSLPRPSRSDVSDKNGLPVPAEGIDDVEVEPEKYPESLGRLLDAMREKPTPSELVEQGKIVKQARESLGNRKWDGAGVGWTGPNGHGPDMRQVCESWHLADMEAWRFVRALFAREQVERKKWKDEEGKFKH